MGMLQKQHLQYLSTAFCDFTLSLSLSEGIKLASSLPLFCNRLVLFWALIILVAGIIFDFHKSWSVGFARLLCSAGTMAIPQPPALPSITIPTNNDTTPNLCV